MMQIRKYMSVSYATGFAVRQLVFLKAWITYLLIRERIDLLVENGGNELLKGNVAIAAIWQKSLCRNFREVLTTLRNEGVKTILINNARFDKQSIEELHGLVSVYMERVPGNGRDIAAYKQGVGYLNSLGIDRSDVKKVIFLNDSVYYIKDRFEKFLEIFLKEEAEVVGVTETTEFHHHVSSWFFSVSKDVFISSIFKNFWEKYKPIQSRVHSIKKGEVSLTRVYKKLGLAPNVIYSTSRILKGLKEIGIRKDEIFNLLPKAARNAFIIKGKLISNKIFWGKLEDLSNSANQTTYWTPILIKYFNFPFVKKDLYSRESYSKSEVDLFLIGNEKDVSDKSIQFINKKMLCKLTTNEEGIFNRLLIKSGVK